MTPKEKAGELFKKLNYKIHTASGHYREQHDLSNCAKECALIAVDEIINYDSYFKTLEYGKEFGKYWNEVQKEINKL